MTTPNILETLGPRATTSPFERQFYARDLAYVPDVLLGLLAKSVPDLVVRPETGEEVAQVLRHASQQGIPVTPRGGGSTAYGNVVPAKAGIVLDLNGLNRIEEVDADAGTVWVEAGVTWQELGHRLNRQGFSVCSYPSSVRTATVGGWFAMGGLGIGSFRYGPLVDRVEALDVVLPNGETKRLTRDTTPPLSWFAGAEGTLGVVTALCLRIRKSPEAEAHVLVEADDAATLTTIAVAAAKQLGEVVFNLHTNSGNYNRILANLGHGELAQGKPTLAIDLDGSEEDVKRCDVLLFEIVSDRGGRLMDPALAREEWDARFHSLRIKRAHPALLGAELTLPLHAFPSYLEGCAQLGASQGLSIASYGHIVSADRVLVMSLFATDERNTVRYIMDTSLLKKIYAIGARLGGAPYAIGLWNTPYLKQAFDAETLQLRKKRKAQLDPKGILNPGKSYRAPLLLHPAVFSPGMSAVGALRRLVAKKEVA